MPYSRRRGSRKRRTQKSRQRSGRRSRSFLSLLSRNKTAAGLSVGGVLLLLLVVLLFVPFGGAPESEPRETDESTTAENDGDGPPEESGATAESRPDPAEVPRPDPPTGVCRVYTADPGFFVLIDGEPARTQEGELLTTPCAVTVARGRHTLTVARDGFQDADRRVDVQDETEVVFESLAEVSGDSTDSVLAAPYFEAPVGEPIPLDSLNTPARELDPFVSADGTTIWFVSDRPEGTGIYMATRGTRYEEFGAPRLLELSRGSRDLPASPSATADGLSVAYAVPAQARIWALTRTGSADAEFTDKTPLKYSKKSEAVWPAAQIGGDGLRLYWTEDEQDQVRVLTASRSSSGGEFGEASEIVLPGDSPCLSPDGLRQYVFDGRQLERALRADPDAPFSKTEVVAEVELPDYVPAADRRQYFVSEDEQWLFYCADPQDEADLAMVRLSQGPGWGVVPHGETIPPRKAATEVAESKPKMEKPSASGSETSEPEQPADPRTQPLPYAEHRREFTALLAERQYDRAVERTQQALADPQFDDDREQLRWDLEEARQARGFWDVVREAFRKLSPGDPLRIGSVKVEFVKLEDDTVVAKARTKEVSKSLRELEPANLLDIVDRFTAETDTQARMRAAVFLYYDRQGSRDRAMERLAKAGQAGEEFLSRRARRKLHLARQEIGRQNMGAALDLIERVIENERSDESVQQARQMRESLYGKTEWRPVGPRNWKKPAPGTYVATLERQPRALLVSPRQYENFELRLEWKAEGLTGQGGVFFGYPGNGPPYENAYKLHLANDHGLKPDQFVTGSLFGMEAPDVNAARPEGEWNSLVLRVQNEEVRATINGKQVLETILLSEDVTAKGYVALDGIVGGITYRRTLLVELPAAE